MKSKIGFRIELNARPDTSEIATPSETGRERGTGDDETIVIEKEIEMKTGTAIDILLDGMTTIPAVVAPRIEKEDGRVIDQDPL